MEDFSGTYTCRAQTVSFKYEGSWEDRGGVVHWAARIRYLSSFWDARGLVHEDRPAKTADAVRRAVEQWIEAFSCGQSSMR